MRVLALIVFAWVLGAAAPSDGHQPKAYESTSTPKGGGENNTPTADVRVSPDKSMAHAKANNLQPDAKDDIELGSWPDWVIVAFTAFLAWLSWRQHELEKRLAADAKETGDLAKANTKAAGETALAMRSLAASSHAAERAYMFLGITSIERQDDGLLKCSVEIANVGRSPGLVRAVYYKIYFGELPGPEPLYEVDGSMAETDLAIAPNTVKLDALEFFLTPEPARPIFYGFIVYEDIFRDFHVSRACILIDRPTLTHLVHGPRSWNEWT